MCIGRRLGSWEAGRLGSEKSSTIADCGSYYAEASEERPGARVKGLPEKPFASTEYFS